MVANPLYGALAYDSPDPVFEKLVEDAPWRVSFVPPGASKSILAKCAEAMKTNYVKILIANGANIKSALQEEKRWRNGKAVQLLEYAETCSMK